jgi:membrane fusion protein, multidrug efflux system
MQNTQHMKISYLFLLLTVPLMLLNAGCSQKKSNHEEIRVKVDTVVVFSLKKGKINKQMTFPAELTPLDKAEIYAKVSGYINEFKVDIGDHVKKGEVLVVLDAPEVLSNYSQNLSDKQTAFAKYQTSLDAYKRLLKASKVNGTVAAEEMEKSKNLMLSDSSAVEASKSKLDANAQLKDYLTIRSPFNGIITQRNFDPGTLVGSNNSKPLLVVENIETLRLRVPVPEAYVMAIPDTSIIHFTVDAQPGKTFAATISRKSGSVNPGNRTEIWEYVYQNKDNQLKSGMFATASINFKRKDLSFLVPESAVVTNLERRFVIRLKNRKADLLDVRNGISQDNKVEIFGNLTEGDTILVRATDEIKPGTRLIGKIATK